MTHNRLIGYFDLLGFRAMVTRDSIETMVARFGDVYTSIGAAAVRHEAVQGMSVFDIAERYETLEKSDLVGVRNAFEHATGMTLLLMSDSVVVYSEPIEPSSDQFDRGLATLVRCSRTIMLKLFELGLPARGALSFGEFYANKDAGIYVGRGLVEAYDAADTQEWVGAVFAASLDSYMRRIDAEFTMDAYAQNKWVCRPRWDFLEYPVPFKTGPRSTLVVNWVSGWQGRGKMAVDPVAKFLTGNPKVDIKYENTREFMRRWSSTPLEDRI